MMIRFLGLAVAALLTANGVIVAEQASNRDLMTLGRDGLANARQAIADLLSDDQQAIVAGEVIEKLSTTTTAPAETTTTTAAPAPALSPPVETTVTSAPPATTPTTAKKPAGKGATDWGHVAETVRPYIEKETSLPFKAAVSVTAVDSGAFNDRLSAVRLNPAMDRARRAEGTLKALGIVEPGVNLAEQVKRLSTGSVTAFYDVKANELVVKNGQLTPFMLKTIVHEMVRANYDQHFELDRPNLATADDETRHRLGQPRRGRRLPDREPLRRRPARERPQVGPGRAAAGGRPAAEGPARLRPHPVRLPLRDGPAVRRRHDERRRRRPRSTPPSPARRPPPSRSSTPRSSSAGEGPRQMANPRRRRCRSCGPVRWVS